MPLKNDPTLWFNMRWCLAAYQPVRGPNPEIVRYNQANGGTNVYRAENGSAPSWSAAIGWTFDYQYLTTGIVPGNYYTVVVRYTASTTVGTVPVGARTGTSGSNGLALWTNNGGSFFFDYGNRVTDGAVPVPNTGVLCLAGNSANYRNGVAITAGCTGTTTTTYPLFIGAHSNSGTAAWHLVGTIQAVAIYARTLSAAEVWIVSQQLTYCDINPEWSVWSRRREWWMVSIPATIYTQAVAGEQTNTGALARGTSTPKSGAWSGAGAIAKHTATSKAGALAGAGGIVRETATSKTGSLTPTGAATKRTATSQAGAWSAAGAITRETGKLTAGAWSGAGAVTRATSKALAGAWSGAGGLVRGIAKALAGAWSGISALVGLPPAHGLVDLTLHTRSVELTLHTRSTSLTVEDR